MRGLALEEMRRVVLRSVADAGPGGAVTCREPVLEQIARTESLITMVPVTKLTMAMCISMYLLMAHSWKPLEGEDNVLLGVHLSRELAYKNGCALAVSGRDIPELREACAQGTDDWRLDELRRWVEGRLVVCPREQETSVESISLSAFVGAPLTGVDAGDLASLEELCQRVASVLAEFGIRSYVAIEKTHPIRNSDLAHDPVIHTIDSHELRDANLVIGVVDRGSTGQGIMFSYAARSSALQLALIQGEAGKSPLLKGASTDITFLTIDDDSEALDTKIREFVGERLPELFRHAREQELAQTEATNLFDELRRGVHRAGRTDLTLALPAGLTIKRLAEILESPASFVLASMAETVLLCEAFGVQLDARQLHLAGKDPAA